MFKFGMDVPPSSALLPTVLMYPSAVTSRFPLALICCIPRSVWASYASERDGARAARARPPIFKVSRRMCRPRGRNRSHEIRKYLNSNAMPPAGERRRTRAATRGASSTGPRPVYSRRHRPESASADGSEQHPSKRARVPAAEAEPSRKECEDKVAAARAALAAAESELREAQARETAAPAAASAAAPAQPKHVPMKEVLTPETREKLQAFFVVARGCHAVPRKSYGELEEFARGMGLEPRSVISFDKQTWDTPSPASRQPGAGRQHRAGNVMNLIIQQLQQCCFGCAVPFASLTALEMRGVDFAHQEAKSPKCPKSTGNLASGSDFDFTFTEYCKCESKCSMCHRSEGE